MANDIDPKALPQKWVHSHEEDTDQEMVFRPGSYKFPPSRGRRSFDLSPDGRVVGQHAGPDDRPTSQVGSWKLKSNNELELDLPGAQPTIMRLVRADESCLVVSKN
jgi:hypothetical protein